MNNLKKYREQLELSQQKLAKRAGVSQPTIVAIESGSVPSIHRARKIVVALCALGAECSLDDVFPPEAESEISASAA